MSLILVGLDDTDTLETRGTNQLARALVRRIAVEFRGRLAMKYIVRHQLLADPRIPCTSKNGSASIWLETLPKTAPTNGTSGDTANKSSGEPLTGAELERLISLLRTEMLADFIPGSDPGLCVAERIFSDVIAWGERCQREIVTKEEAYAVAQKNGLFLEELGGTGGGVIGALAAIGLAAAANDGRIISLGDPDYDLSGIVEFATLRKLGISWEVVPSEEKGFENGFANGILPPEKPGEREQVDVGKHLRPNLRGGRPMLYVEPRNEGTPWGAIKRT